MCVRSRVFAWQLGIAAGVGAVGGLLWGFGGERKGDFLPDLASGLFEGLIAVLVVMVVVGIVAGAVRALARRPRTGSKRLTLAPRRTFVVFGSRLAVVILLIPFFMFAALEQPVLQSLFAALDGVLEAIEGYYDLLELVYDHGETTSFVPQLFLLGAVVVLAWLVVAVAWLGLGTAGRHRESGPAGAVASLGFLRTFAWQVVAVAIVGTVLGLVWGLGSGWRGGALVDFSLGLPEGFQGGLLVLGVLATVGYSTWSLARTAGGRSNASELSYPPSFIILAYHVAVVVLVLAFFVLAALDQPVLRSLYEASKALYDTFGSYFDFVVHVHEHAETISFVYEAYLRTMVLLLTAVILGGTIGVGLGLLSGLRPGSKLAGIASYASLVGVLTPSFLLGLVVLMAFVRYVGPALEIRFVLLDPQVDILDPRRLMAPALVLSARPIAFMAQVTIGALQDVVPAGYVRTAYAKGLPFRAILGRHVLPNVAVPVLGALNSSFFFALSSIFVIEWLFNWGGVGSSLLESVLAGDTLRASYLLIFIAVTMFLVNTVVELTVRRIDRRVPEVETFVS